MPLAFDAVLAGSSKEFTTASNAQAGTSVCISGGSSAGPGPNRITDVAGNASKPKPLHDLNRATKSSLSRPFTRALLTPPSLFTRAGDRRASVHANRSVVVRPRHRESRVLVNECAIGVLCDFLGLLPMA
jgi:hypothetical protein